MIFSAHGVSPAVREEAQARGLKIFDATCPLVTKVHVEVIKMRKEGMHVIMIGHRGHPEVEGTMGQAPDGIQLVENISDVQSLTIPLNSSVAYVTQTTLSVDETQEIVDALKAKYPHIQQPVS